MFNFIREKGDACEGQPAFNRTDGETIKKTYEEIVNAPSTSSGTISGITTKSKQVRQKRARPKRVAFDEKKFFEGAVKDDVALLELMSLSPENINRRDQFGWSALMMAACEGSLNAVKFLLRNNANESIADRRGRTALLMAESKGHSEIVELLKKEAIVISSSDENETVEAKTGSEDFYCAVCDSNMAEANRDRHLVSTLHRFNEKNAHKFARHFGIPDSNVGFRMMLRQGWNRQSGLGPQKDGHLYPVKTVIRKSRSGLGTRQPNTAKVTHFRPFDANAVKSLRPPQPPATTGRQMRRQKACERRNERHLRNMLSWLFRLHPIFSYVLLAGDIRTHDAQWTGQRTRQTLWHFWSKPNVWPIKCSRTNRKSSNWTNGAKVIGKQNVIWRKPATKTRGSPSGRFSSRWQKKRESLCLIKVPKQMSLWIQ